MRKWLKIVLSLAALTLCALTLAACDSGNVTKVEWKESSTGVKTCNIVVRPDNMDSAPYTLKDQFKARCDACPVGARFPDCAKSKEGSKGKKDPDPPKVTKTWDLPGAGAPTHNPGDRCTDEGVKGRTSDGRPLRCHDNKWTLS